MPSIVSGPASGGVSPFATDADLAAHEADTTSIHGIADTSALLTSAAGDAAYARLVDLDVRDYGGFTGVSTWDVNRDGLQAANDAATALPQGAKVHLPAGSFPLKGVYLDSRVHIVGHGTELTHPDGDSTDMIKGRVGATTGTIATSGSTITVASATGIEVGTVIAVDYAAGYSPLQFTALGGDIDSSQTSGITLTASTGFPSSGWLAVGTEVIAYTGISSLVLTGVTRGAYGTTAAAHTSGDYIGTAKRLVAEVTAVSGTSVTIDRAATIGVTAAAVAFGIIHAGVSDLAIDGNRASGGAATQVSTLRLDLARWCLIENVTVTDAESALFLAQGSRDNTIRNITAYDCSVPEGSKGSVFWLFQGCQRNHLSNLTVNGSVWIGLYMDNRTTTATGWDASNDENVVDGFRVRVPTPSAWTLTTVGAEIVGGSRNKIVNASIRGVRTGFTMTHDDQALTGDSGAGLVCANNVLANVTVHDGYQPWVLTSPGNVILASTFTTQTNGSNDGANLLIGSTPSSGDAPILGGFGNGTQSKPTLRFASETNTGFYRITTGEWEWVSAGALIMRLRASGIKMDEGMNIEFGTATGSRLGSAPSVKIGLWGATPVVQPVAVADATDATSVITQLNSLLAKLRAVGVIASS